MYKDKALTCKDCGKEFVFSASEQEFYAKKGFNNEPVRCSDCRNARKAKVKSSTSRGGFGGRPQRKMFSATCSSCGQSTSVPFKPSGDKPVYCKDCFDKRR